MVGFIFGIIFLIAGIITAVCLASYKHVEKTEEYVLDENGERVRAAYGGWRTTTKETVTKPLAKFSVVSAVAGVFLAILLTFFGCIASVDTGHVGIVKTFGKVEDYTFDSGFHLKAPWNSVTQMDNRVQKTTVELSCFSSDIQEVTISYTVNYQISKTNAQNLYRDVGTNYLETVVNPTIQESVKTIVAQYKAEGDETNGGLVKNRAEVAEKIEVILNESLQKYNIDVVSTAIENMDFTDSFTNAVEAKAGRMFASAASYELKVIGHKTPKGELWRKNMAISLVAPGAMVYKESTFLIDNVTIQRSDSDGNVTTLKLVLPGARDGSLPEEFPWEEQAS